METPFHRQGHPTGLPLVRASFNSAQKNIHYKTKFWSENNILFSKPAFLIFYLEK